MTKYFDEMTDQEKETVRAKAKEFRAIRKEAGLKIDPETAEIHWTYGSVLDPYGFYNLGPDAEDNIGRNYWARSPGSDVWVEFGDLPDATRKALWDRMERGDVDEDGFPKVPSHQAVDNALTVFMQTLRRQHPNATHDELQAIFLAKAKKEPVLAVAALRIAFDQDWASIQANGCE